MKTKRIPLAVLAMTVALGIPALAAEEQSESKPAEIRKQTVCPVMGGKINPKQYVDVKGYRIYICCAGCKAKIKADPDAYIKKLTDSGVTPEKIPEKAVKTESDTDSD